MSLRNIYIKARQDRVLARHLVLANDALTKTGYLAYVALIVLSAIFNATDLVEFIIIPALGFISVSVVRYLINEPRPYEAGDLPPLMPKSTSGKSFPSRHTFCMFMIALSWVFFAPAPFPPLGPIVGSLLLICACLMACLRVICGVHYIHDVVAGALCAAAFSALYLLNWAM